MSNNNFMISESFTILSEIMLDILNNHSIDFQEFNEEIETIDKISIILKRLGDTVIIENSSITQDKGE